MDDFDDIPQNLPYLIKIWISLYLLTKQTFRITKNLFLPLNTAVLHTVPCVHVANVYMHHINCDRTTCDFTAHVHVFAIETFF